MKILVKRSIFLSYFLSVYLFAFMRSIPGMDMLPYALLFLSVFILGISFFYTEKKIARLQFLERSIYILIFFSILSWGSAYYNHGQSLLKSFYTDKFIVILLLYFAFCRLSLDKKYIIKILTVFTVFYFFVNILNILVYDFVGIQLFGLRGWGNNLEYRLGLPRFDIPGGNFIVVPLFYYWDKFLKYKTHKTIFIICFISICFSLERMIMFPSFFLLAIYSMLLKKNKIIPVLTTVLFLSSFLLIQDCGNNSLINKTVVELNNEDDVRNFSRAFYGYEYYNGIETYLFGNGPSNPDTSYGEEIRNFEKTYGLYKVDVGIFGDMNTYGYLYAFCVLILPITLIVKYKKHLPQYIKFVLLFWELTIVQTSYIGSTYRNLCFVTVLYLVYLFVEEGKKIKPRLLCKK